MTRKTLLLGAVAYDPKVVTIWEGFREFFRAHDFEFDVVMFTNYERQVAAHLEGAIDVAWNSPLAWLQFEAAAKQRGREVRAVCMRDSDRDLTSFVVVRDGGGIDSVEQARAPRRPAARCMRPSRARGGTTRAMLAPLRRPHSCQWGTPRAVNHSGASALCP